ncbi:MAG: hypothetical protein ABI741_04125 [Ferruginibacter sp.]
MENKKEDFPNVTLEDSQRFWEAFATRHPEIYKQFTSTQFINGSIIAFKPKTMDENSFSIYERYLKRWHSDNGFWNKQIDEIYVSLNENKNKDVRAINTDTIIEITGVNDNVSKIVFKEDDMSEPITIFVTEFVEDLKKNVYIF